MKNFFVVLLVLFHTILFSSRSIAEETTKDIAFEGFKLSLKADESSSQISIEGTEGALKTHSELIKNPDRFFIDVLGVQSRTARSIDLNSGIIKRIRVGIHREKTRIVFDIRDSVTNINFKEEDLSKPDTGEFNYLFKLSGNASHQQQLAPETKEEVTTPTPSPSPTPNTKLIDKEDAVPPSPTDTPEMAKPTIEPTLEIIQPQTIPSAIASPTIEEKPTTTPTPTPEPTALSQRGELEQAVLDISNSGITKNKILKNVVFQTTSDNIQSSIAIYLSEIGTYHSLTQESPSRYILSLPDTRLRANHLSLPQYPPDSFKGYVYMKAEETPSGSNVIIVVDPGVKLSLEVFQNKLWIKAQ